MQSPFLEMSRSVFFRRLPVKFHAVCGKYLIFHLVAGRRVDRVYYVAEHTAFIASARHGNKKPFFTLHDLDVVDSKHIVYRYAHYPPQFTFGYQPAHLEL